MALNDSDLDEFAAGLEYEYTFDAHPPPGVEIGEAVPPMRIQPDYGSGSYAEDGPLEVAEDKVMMNGESQVGSAAMYGPTEIGEESEVGAGLYPVDGASEIGSDVEDELGAGLYPVDGASEIGAEDELGAGLYPVDGASEIGAGLYPVDGASEIGGPYAESGAAEIGAGLYPVDGASEIGAGLYPVDGASEIGARADVMAPFESFMLDETHMGVAGVAEADALDNWYEDFAVLPSGSEIGRVKAAVARVVEKARDNRAPAPPMKVVHVDTPVEEDEWGLSDLVIGAAVKTGRDQFPLTTKLLQRAGAGMEPRYVRIDTEESYKQFRAQNSPEQQELRALRERLEAHIADPMAHEISSNLEHDIEDLVLLGKHAQTAEEEKRLELWMPKRFDGKVEAWHEGDFVGASIALPGPDGEVRVATSLEPIAKCVGEMSQHAAEAGVPAETVVGVLPAMGCVLGAGTALKEMAAAAPAILKQPEAKRPEPFVCRIEPKTSPAIGALMMLIMECRRGNVQAQKEWAGLGAVSPPVIKQAMGEALQLCKAVAK